MITTAAIGPVSSSSAVPLDDEAAGLGGGVGGSDHLPVREVAVVVVIVETDVVLVAVKVVVVVVSVADVDETVVIEDTVVIVVPDVVVVVTVEVVEVVKVTVDVADVAVDVVDRNSVTVVLVAVVSVQSNVDPIVGGLSRSSFSPVTCPTAILMIARNPQSRMAPVVPMFPMFPILSASYPRTLR